MAASQAWPPSVWRGNTAALQLETATRCVIKGSVCRWQTLVGWVAEEGQMAAVAAAAALPVTIIATFTCMLQLHPIHLRPPSCLLLAH